MPITSIATLGRLKLIKWHFPPFKFKQYLIIIKKLLDLMYVHDALFEINILEYV